MLDGFNVTGIDVTHVVLFFSGFGRELFGVVVTKDGKK